MSERNKLMQLMYETDDMTKRNAIAQRIVRLDAEAADSHDRGPLDFLSVPQQALKKGVAKVRGEGADEREWFSSEGMPTWAYAAGNTALDIVADPLNVVGAGLFGKGAKTANKLTGKGSGKGMHTAAADNYINNYYVPDMEKDPTWLEKVGAPLVQQQAKKIFGRELKPDELKGAVQRQMGAVSTVLKASKAAGIDAFSPKARALWKEHGISAEGQRIIKGHMDETMDVPMKGGRTKVAAKPDAYRPIPKAGGEAIYQFWQDVQSGRAGKTHPALMRFMEQSLEEFPTPNKSGTIKDMLQRNTAQRKIGEGRGSTWEDIEIPDETARFMEDFVQEQWPGTDLVAMKAGEKLASGKHLMDLVGLKNPSMSVYKQAMKDLPTNASKEELAHALRQAAKTNSIAKKYKVDVITDPKTGDIYLSSSRPGSAIVEGGYRGLHKVDPNGDYIALMSDEHNFLESTPLLGKVVGQYLPNNLLAISPPIMGNVLKKGDKGIRQVAAKKAAQNKKKVPAPSMEENLREIASALPSNEVVRAEQMKQTGVGMMTGALQQEDEQ